MNSKEVKQMRERIEHTLLKPEATPEAIAKLCKEAVEYRLFGVCVNPCYVKLAKTLLQSSPVQVVTVIGFPLGANTTDIKTLETKQAVMNGAGEIDMVMNIGALKTGDTELVQSDIAHVVSAASGRPVKVIIETCPLTKEEKILAVKLIAAAHANFVKTSTGFNVAGATVEDVALLRHEADKYGLKVKAAGGIRDKATAKAMVEAGADRIGTSSGPKLVEGDHD
jgi:deoxyribose-phosphate aldolase